MNAANPALPHALPPEPDQWRAWLLAALVHGLLFAFLWVGVRWQNEVPLETVAEVWDMQAQDAAPLPTPQETPPPQEQPAPLPQPAPPPPPVERTEPKQAAPDIALEQDRKRKEKKRMEQDQEQKALAQQRKLEELEKAQKLAKKQADDESKRLAAEKEKEKAKKSADKKAADLADKAEKKKLADAKKAKEAAEQAARDKTRAEEMRRIAGATANSGNTGSGGSGEASKSTGQRGDPSYGAAVMKKIRDNISYAGSTDAPGNPRALFKIDLLPNGEIIGVRKLKSSGIPAFDNAVENGIHKSSPLPKKKDGTVEREIEAGVSLKELGSQN